MFLPMRGLSDRYGEVDTDNDIKDKHACNNSGVFQIECLCLLPLNITLYDNVIKWNFISFQSPSDEIEKYIGEIQVRNAINCYLA